MSTSRCLNINLGIVGHVDSGKTSLARALSTHLSTAALDKTPQSQERGITLDLGFSAFYVESPPSLCALYDRIQFTLVDCPGHASLIRTIIGGAEIIDIMLLVIDATKGIQTQTAELEKGLRQTFKGTKFGADVEIVYIAANPEATTIDEQKSADSPIRNSITNTQDNSTTPSSAMVAPLISLLSSSVSVPHRDPSLPFFYSIDHCFPVKGQGAVLTGTILSGHVSIGDVIELPLLKEQRKVKSMQMFHTPVTKANAGDRVAICVTAIDPSLIERGMAAAINSVRAYQQAIAVVEKIRFYKGEIKDRAKFHISILHSTIMAECQFFTDEQNKEASSNEATTSSSFSFDRPYLHQSQLFPTSTVHSHSPQYVLLTFASPIYLPVATLQSVPVIALRLDAQQTGKSCRLAFYGKIIVGIGITESFSSPSSSSSSPSSSSSTSSAALLQFYRHKEKRGEVDRIYAQSPCLIVIGRGMFRSVDEVNRYVGMLVDIEGMGTGRIEAAFGKGGKFRVEILNNNSTTGTHRKSDIANTGQSSTSSSPAADQQKSQQLNDEADQMPELRKGGKKNIILRLKQLINAADGKKKLLQTN